MAIRIKFCGAAGTVTGSKYLLEAAGKKFLVDSGLFQGSRELRELNWQPFPEAEGLDFVLLTHGHLDHVGYLPCLLKYGFSGPVYGTAPTLDVAKVILSDSAKIQEEDAARANALGYSRHEPAMPLYTGRDVEQLITHFKAVEAGKFFKIADGIEVRFRYNGHILGATFIEIRTEDRLLVFSGDIGRYGDPLLDDPDMPDSADLLVMESTYGGQLHEKNSLRTLQNMIHKAFVKGSTIIIPSFAVERSQLLVHMLWQLKKSGRLPAIPVYVDTPMGINVFDLFRKHLSWHKLSKEDCEEMCAGVRLVKDLNETQAVMASSAAKIIIAGSGMIGGGRVMVYLQKYISDRSCILLLAGYQAEGTKGRALLDGAKNIRLMGKDYKVKCKVSFLPGLSAHADQKELLQWISALKNKPAKIFLTHGEHDAAVALRKKIAETYGWETSIPRLNDEFTFSEKIQPSI